MTAKLIMGTEIREEILDEVQAEVAAIKEKHGVVPGLVTIQVGENPASTSYVTLKIKTAIRLGFHEVQDSQPEDISEADLLALVDKYNKDDSINGILVQLPLPKHIDDKKVLNAIDPDKDVDGFHPVNVGRLMIGGKEVKFPPCTPAGIQEMIVRSGMETSGAECVVVGRSNIVGKPMAQLLLGDSCTVTIAHSRTTDLPGVVRRADIVVAAVGRPLMVSGDWIKPGATVIDVGMNRLDDKLLGDVEFEAAAERARAISPVPGGVGPMTIAMLMHNTVQAAERAV